MRTILRAVVVAACVCAGAEAAPVQWAGNGSYYEFFSPAGGIRWSDAKAAAESLSHEGRAGHLVTLGSAEEFAFVRSAFPNNFTWIGLSDAETEGTFAWVTGEPVTYTGWLLNEPNNSASDPPGEDYAWYENRGGSWGWNDYQDLAATVAVNQPIAYVVEYSVVPEPGGAIAGLCACAVVVVNRRMRMQRPTSSRAAAPHR